jgi:N-acetylglucosamine kinase-like BadF-type ATPase
MGVGLRHVLGVDGGGSKTHTLIIDEAGNAIGFGEAEGSNYQICGIDQAAREINLSVHRALETAKLTPKQIQQGCFCLAGADLPEDYVVLSTMLETLDLAQQFTLKNDTMAALRAGLSRPWGIGVICGTGINAAGRSPDGREVTFPSLGVISGDWGGGTDLITEIIRLVMRAWDGRGGPTLLTKMVLNKLGASSEEELLGQLRHHKIEQRALQALVPLLFEAAVADDQVAQDLVIRMGTEIGVSANALIRRLTLENADVEVVLAGGVTKGKGPLLIKTVTRVVQNCAPRATILRARYEPVVGAALLALDLIGVDVAGNVHTTLEVSTASLGLKLMNKLD